MTKEFNNLEELKPYYDEKTNTYIFKEKGRYIDVKFNFNLIVDANIDAHNITADNIDACNISFHAFCISYNNIKCTSIKGRRENHIMKALDGDIIIKGESKC